MKRKQFSADVYYDTGPGGGWRLYAPESGQDGYVDHPVDFTRSADLTADVKTWVRCMAEVYADYGVKMYAQELIYAAMTANNNRWRLTTPDRVRFIMILIKELNRG